MKEPLRMNIFTNLSQELNSTIACHTYSDSAEKFYLYVSVKAVERNLEYILVK